MKKMLLVVIIVLVVCFPLQAYGMEKKISYTSPTQRVNSDNGIINFIATMKTSQYESQYDKARVLYDFVIDYMSYDVEQLEDRSNPKYTYTATEALSRRKGICYEYALFYAALCRSIGIPSQVSKGDVKLSGSSEVYYHAWNRVYIDGTWLSVDPTLGDVSEDCRNDFFDFKPEDRILTGVE